jgi:hypothetical protein
MVICAFENSPSIPSFLATQIVYIRYGQFKKKFYKSSPGVSDFLTNKAISFIIYNILVYIFNISYLINT